MPPGDQQLRQARFWRKFMLLTRGRIEVRRALDIIIAEEADASLQQQWRSLRAAVLAGQPLSEALEAAPGTFSRAVRELVRSAEQSGAWDDILPLIAQGLEDGTFD
ncbi:MAG: type II secretion system F family protein [Lentisphaerae bacterium]|nr:type II secretion system F family protein [Lentisphaerota bacterium]